MSTKLDTMAERESYVDRLRDQRDAAIAERDALREEVGLLHAAIESDTAF